MNIIYNDNEVIGKIEDIKQLFLNRIKEEIDTEELEISEKLEDTEKKNSDFFECVHECIFRLLQFKQAFKEGTFIEEAEDSIRKCKENNYE